MKISPIIKYTFLAAGVTLIIMSVISAGRLKKVQALKREILQQEKMVQERNQKAASSVPLATTSLSAE